MLWSPSEVLAYLKEDLGIQDGDIFRKDNCKIKTIAAFGGFQTWPSINDDFILIAENSEIHGPNPLFTIPLQHPDVDLNMLSTKILSADYQALSHKKFISLSHSQLLMPDIGPDVHVAANYFLLFDSEARGFIRPMCLAYFTADKNKVMSLSGSILKDLSRASSVLQHTNILHSIQELKNLMKDINSAGNVRSTDRKASLHNYARESVLEDIQDVLTILEEYEKNKIYEEQILSIYENMKKMSLSEEIRNFFFVPASFPSQHFHKQRKCMKDLHHICDKGLVLGLYHLFIVHKHFRRKNENIVLSRYFPNVNEKGDSLCFGACLRSSSRSLASNTSMGICALNVNNVPDSTCMESDKYFQCLNGSFQNVLLDFINREKNLLDTSEHSMLSRLSSCGISDSSNELNSSFYLGHESASFENERSAVTLNEIECGHIVNLDRIWDILEVLEKENPDAESTLLEILKLFDDTQRLLFCIFTRIPVVILSTPEEFLTAQKFIKALSVFIPRRRDEMLYVDVDRREPILADHFRNIAAVNICIHDYAAVADFIPLELLQSLCILNLKDSSFTAPGYMGVLLADIDERLKLLPLDGPVFPILIDVILEVQRTLHWWQTVISSTVDSSSASCSILSRQFSRFDVQILMKLSSLCIEKCTI